VALRHHRHGGRAGHAGFFEYWAGGAMERAERTNRWYLDNAHLLQEALF
jgi:hypothetical protein